MRFDSNGNLIGRILDSTYSEVYKNLAEDIQDSNHRKDLLKLLKEMFEDKLLKLYTESITHIYIDGSFCTNKLKPEDVDILALLNLSNTHGLELSGNEELQKQIRRYAKDNYKVDFLCTPDSETLPSNVSQYDTIKSALYQQSEGWLNFFTKDRNSNPKAVVKIIVEGGVLDE